MNGSGPPAWARLLARGLVPSRMREFVLGDLEEMYHAERERHGHWRATRLYLWLVARSAVAGVSSGVLFEDFRTDLRFALRGFRRNPTFAAVTIGTTAIGVGATTAILSVGNAVLVRPPPVVDPGALVSIWELRTGDVRESTEGRLLVDERYRAYRDATGDVFEGLAGHGYATVAVGTDAGAQAVHGFVTSDNYFSVLGLVPLHGRLYSREDDAVVVISERLWRARFGSDPDIVGRVVAIDSSPFVVAGVAPPGFFGTMSTFSGDVWIPRRSYVEAAGVPGFLVPIGRIRAGLSREVAELRVSEIARQIEAGATNADVTGVRLDGILWRGDLAEVLFRGVAILLGAAALLLLIAVANIAGMMMARTLDRSRENAVRLAMGAGRGRMVRQGLVESVVLALVGGALGTVLATAATSALSRIEFPIEATLTVDATPDPRVLVATLFVSLAAGVLFGLGPVLRSSRIDVQTSLKSGVVSGRTSPARNLMVTGQLALSTMLLVTAGVLARSNRAVADVPLGFDPGRVTVGTVALGAHGYDEAETRAFHARLLDRVRDTPGVDAAGLGRFVLLGGANASNRVTPLDHPEGVSANADYNVVDSAYFAATGVELLRGRFFGERDLAEGPRVAVVNESFVERFWPGESGVGRSFRIGSAQHDIVGVVRDGVYVFTYEEPRLYAYFSYAQRYPSGITLHVRTNSETVPVGDRIREIVRDLDPNVAVSGVRTMEQVVSSNGFAPRFIARLTSILAVIGLFLAVIGVYGLMAVQVARRRPEFSVRMAIGSTRPDVVALVLRTGLVVTLFGVGLGLVLAAFATRWLAALLFGVDSLDPFTFVAVPLVLGVAAITACLVPAVRGSSAEPSEALRVG